MHFGHWMVMCKSSLLMLSSHKLIICLNARCLCSSSDRTVFSLVDVINATSASSQRQHCENPTSLPLAAAGGIPASIMLLGDPLESTSM